MPSKSTMKNSYYKESLADAARSLQKYIAEPNFYHNAPPSLDREQNCQSPDVQLRHKKLLDEARLAVDNCMNYPSFDPTGDPIEAPLCDQASHTAQSLPSSQPQFQQLQVIQHSPRFNGMLGDTSNFNFLQCFVDLQSKYPQVPLQALATTFNNLYLRIKYNDIDVVKATLTGCQDGFGYLYDSRYVYLINPDILKGYPRGYWRSKDGQAQGLGCIDLRMHITGATELEVIEDIAGIFGMKFSDDVVTQQNGASLRFLGLNNTRRFHAKAWKRDQPGLHSLGDHGNDRKNLKLAPFVTQQDCQNELSWIPYPSTYDTKYFGHPVFDKFCFASKPYVFCTESGQPSFSLYEWLFGFKAFRLFCTLRNDNFTNQINWEFIAPPSYKHMIYNRHMIDKFNNSEVHIHDEISRATSQNIEHIVPTWSGDLSIASSLNWEFLKGRKVRYVFDETVPDSYKIGDILIKKFRKDGIFFVLQFASQYEESTENKIISNYKSVGGCTICNWIGEADFYAHAKRRYPGLCLESMVDEIVSCIKTNDDYHGLESPSDWLLEPFCVKDELILAVGETNAGKTFVCIDFAAALATGGSIGTRLKAIRPVVTLYIDSELPGKKFMKRFKDLLVNYGNVESVPNFKYVSLLDEGKTIDLSTHKDQAWLEKVILESKAEFVVIDSLSGVLPYGSEQKAPKWQLVHIFLRSITSRGITVLIAHHLNKKGDPLGTNKIRHDVDLAISIKRTDCLDEETIAEISFTKTRYVFGKLRKPFTIEYFDGNGGTMRDVDGERKGESHAPCLVSQGDNSLHGLTGIELDIYEFLRNSRQKFFKRGDIVKNVKCKSPETVRKYLAILFDKRLVKTTGEGSGTKYFLPENAPTIEIHTAEVMPESLLE